MAILSKIREKSAFLIVVIGLALFAFVASPEDILNFFSTNRLNLVGNVNDQEIKRKEFVERTESYRRSMRNLISQMQAVNKVWEDIVKDYLYAEQLKKAGVVVGEKEIWEVIINLPEIQSAPIFKNEAGFFDENKFKDHIAKIKKTSQNTATGDAWQNWLSTEQNIKKDLQRKSYNELVSLGIIASSQETKAQYKENNTKLYGSYIYVPYTSVEDEKVQVTEKEVEDYINAHQKNFKVSESRDISYVFFPIEASEKDREDIKNDLEKLKKDKEIYISATKQTELFLGFENMTHVEEFFAENISDLPLNLEYRFRNVFPDVAAEAIFTANKGEVIGPYEFEGYYKMSKVLDIKKMPDSVKANHILITYKGAASADEKVTKTEQQAKKTADSILKVIRRSPKKFKILAEKFSADKSNAEKGGDLGWFGYNQMVPEFRDFCFQNKKGKISVVKTTFGYHVIKIKEQKNIQKTLKVATYARKIEASDTTENNIFEQAETFAYNLFSGKDYDELVEEKKYQAVPLIGLKKLDEKVGLLNNQRNIVRWAFDEKTIINSSKRFDVESGYAVVVLKSKTPEGLMSVSKAFAQVAPKIRKRKKADVIKEKFQGRTLDDISKSTQTPVENFEEVTMENPILSGVGLEPAVVGAMYASPENKLIIPPLQGENGMFVFKITKKEPPTELQNYEDYAKNLQRKYRNEIEDHLYESLKRRAEIEDYRADIY